MNHYCTKNTMEKAASRARGDRLEGLYGLCERQKVVTTSVLIRYVDAMHESDKLDSIHFRDMALRLAALEAEVQELRQQSQEQSE